MNQKSQSKLIICWLTLLSIVYFVGWTDTLITSTPGGGDNPQEVDDRIRELKAAFVERHDVDHYWTASATSTFDHADTGKHDQITFLDWEGSPTPVAGNAHLYMVSDELWWQDDTNTKIQLTTLGQIEYQSIADVNNDTYIVAVDAAGTGTVDLIKGDANDLAVIADGSETATNAAPACTKGIANKKYVDDAIDSGISRYVVLKDIKTAATAGGGSVADTWTKRDVAEISDPDNICSVSSSVIVLSAGNYFCRISAPAFRSMGHQIRLRNTSGAPTTLLTGTNALAEQDTMTHSNIIGYFTVAASQNLEIQHNVASNRATDGLGKIADFTGVEEEVYTVAEFWKVE